MNDTVLVPFAIAFIVLAVAVALVSVGAIVFALRERFRSEIPVVVTVTAAPDLEVRRAA